MDREELLESLENLHYYAENSKKLQPFTEAIDTAVKEIEKLDKIEELINEYNNGCDCNAFPFELTDEKLIDCIQEVIEDDWNI